MRQYDNRSVGINQSIFKNGSLIWLGIFIYCLLVSLVFLLICTKSSPLYPLNDWVDSNIFFTMGKGMINGAVPYRDLFEQKGPLLYFIHGLTYLISNTTFLGVFVFEVIAFSVFLYYCHRISSLFLNIKYSIISLSLIAATVLNTKAFFFGDSAEEFCLPLIVISLYYLINYFKNVYPQPINNRWLVVNGFVAGCVLWIKFSLLGFWIGWVFSISILPLQNKEYLRIIKSWVFFLCGMILATLPWIVYFGINNSIIDWLESYLYINTVYYSVQIPFLERIIFVIKEIIMGIALNPILGYLIIVGILAFAKDKGFIRHRSNRIGLLLCVLLLIVGTYGGGKGYLYYFLAFSPFVILGFIAIMSSIKTNYDNAITIRKSAVTALIIILITLPLTLEFNHNTYMLGSDKQDMFQYKFAAAMSETEGNTLLNYGSLDLGLYTVTNITPNVRFFFRPNIAYSRFPLIVDEQNRYIKDKEVDYVLMMTSASQNIHEMDVPYLYENYNLIMEHDAKTITDKYSWGNEFLDFKYLLFQLK